ncbi:PilC/PilY family type IV pilus protein [Acinetobacter rongchengensis]|uniref:Pilus assembly protein PilY n=1 Tax=Acinetobacter rongchengensis TaxID=2419601 RepID=A0A3A8ET88_9GAMM|nr:PilC/PilY family type IV pilus protein [Acinetobacter rongchengensis]RKG38072.1 pilus assembly protein PilY [Acinetobacter rongchengensis]
MQIFNQKVLSATVSMLMTWSLCQVATTYASDIDIYKLPDQTKLSIMMMLDTSGSMDQVYMGDNSACDLPANTSPLARISNVPHPEGRGYTRNYCQVGGTKRYYYYYYNSRWYECNGITNTPSTSRCTRIYTTPDTSNYISESNNTRFFSYDGGTPYYDRISRLKDALYELAVSNSIPPKTKIGIGNYSYNGEGAKGYIRIAANEWGEANTAQTSGSQRNKLLTLIKSPGFAGDGGTPTATAYAEAAAALLGTTTGGGVYSGIGQAEDSSTEVFGGVRYYKRPVDDTEPKCSGKGIYVLTDGLPNAESGATATMITALTKRGASTSTSGYSTSYGTFIDKTSGGWSQIGYFARSLNDGSQLQNLFNSTRNNDQHQVKTAVVGFGNVFDVSDPNGNIRKNIADPKNGKIRTYYNCSLLTGPDQKNACYWGNKTKFSDGTLVPGIGNTATNPNSYGEGGFYSAKSTDDVIKSFVNFVEDVTPKFEPVATGSPTIPIDQLNPVQVQPYGYYAQFTPKPQDNYQLWLGNFNKYYTQEGELKGLNSIALIKGNGELNPSAIGIWGEDGMKGKIPLGTSNTTSNALRNVFTNRKIDNLNQAQEDNGLHTVDLNALFGTNSTDAKLLNDPKKNYWLNILGYAVAKDATGLTATNLPTVENRQIGAVMHSTPILLTQSGKVDVLSNGTVTSSDRDDYLLFGSTQGILHVVKAGKPDLDSDPDAGKEVFAFVPHEIMEKQSLGFLSEGNTNEGRANLYYGIDGAWTVFSQYVSNSDGSLTIKDSDRTDLQTKKGMQLVFGGMRMGGRSYYALDLQNIKEPKLKFHINPQDTVTNADATTTVKATLTNSSGTKTVEALSFMGQSWSKPTVTYINWGGQRKLVMFVGGGYDTGYENTAYDQSNKKGAGVYMFDANDGELLWWASANSSADKVAYTANVNLKYSVVSQINAVDRDNDGLSDTLYFGDLGGQAFRIDLNNKTTSTDAFATRVVRLYNGHLASGKSPRFYEMPSFSAQDKGVDGLYGVLALSSGNRSSPLAGKFTSTNNVTTTTTSAKDGVFVIFDHDIARTDLYSIEDTSLRIKEITNLPVLDLNVGVADATVNGTTKTYNSGWVYYYPTSSYGDGHIKGMNELYALDSMLYVNTYDKDGVGIAKDCGSGVIGDSYLYQFCLPSGKCKFYSSETTEPNRVKLGGGILGTGLGQAYSGGGMGLIVKREGGKDCTKVENKNLPECQLFDAKSKLQHLRWYESR